MTLVLSSIAKNTAFHVSDRQISTVQNNRIDIFDPASNKCIVFFPRNGFVTIGYSGTAYINQVETDRWIAEILARTNLEGEEGFRIGHTPSQWDDIGLTVTRLLSSLNNIWINLPRLQQNQGLTISIVGWQLHRSKRRWKPVLWEIIGSVNGARLFDCDRQLRFFPSRQVGLSTIGYGINDGERQIIINSLLLAMNQGSADQYEDLLINKVLEIAQSSDTVSSNCMSVRLVASNPPIVRIGYIHNDPITLLDTETIDHLPGMVIGFGTVEKPVDEPPRIDIRSTAFMPWIVSENSIYPPSSIVGNMEITLPGLPYIIRIAGAQPPEGIFGGFIAQSRPNRP